MVLGHKIPVERKAANVTCLKRGKIKLLVVPLVGKLVKGFVYDQFIPCTRLIMQPNDWLKSREHQYFWMGFDTVDHSNHGMWQAQLGLVL